MGTALPIFFLCLSISCWLHARTRLVTCNRYQRWYWWWGRGSRQGWKDCVKLDPQIPLRICRSETAKETAGRPLSCQNNQCFPQRSEQNCSFVGVSLLSHSFSFPSSLFSVYLYTVYTCLRQEFVAALQWIGSQPQKYVFFSGCHVLYSDIEAWFAESLHPSASTGALCIVPLPILP